MLKTQQAHLDPAGFGHKLPHFLCVWLLQVCVCSHSSQHDTPVIASSFTCDKNSTETKQMSADASWTQLTLPVGWLLQIIAGFFLLLFIEIHFRVLSSRCKENSRTVEKSEPKHIKGKIMHALVVDTSWTTGSLLVCFFSYTVASSWCVKEPQTA